MQKIWLNGKCYAHADILAFRTKHDEARGFTETGRETLRFCGQWLAGETSFTITTSGSTAQPKVISQARAHMALSARLTGQALGLTAGDTALACLSPAYIAGRMMLVRALELDLQLVVVEPAKNPLISPHLDDFDKLDFTALVPFQLQEILTAGGVGLARLNRMKAVLVGGAPVSVALEKALPEVAAPIYQTFGMTETVSHFALRRLNGAEKSDVYRVLPGVEIACDGRGCLLVTSGLTGGCTIVTNDRVELLSPTSFVWLGRIDNVINSGGFKVQAEKVERALAEYFTGRGEMAGQNTFFVGGLPDPELGEKVVAVFEGDHFESQGVDELRAAFAGPLHKYELPRACFHLPKFSRTPTGKIQRRETLALLLKNLSGLSE